MMTNTYFEYLNNISWKGLLYRRFLVYPVLNKFCNGRVLDVGCGVGQFVKYQKAAKGVDVNEDCVKFCKAQGLDVIKMDYDELPFVENSFDTIVLDNVIEHITNPLPLLSECRRVLTNDGTIIVLVPGKKGFKRDSDHKKFYDHIGLRQLIAESNFETMNNISLPFPKLGNVLSAFCFMIVARNSKVN